MNPELLNRDDLDEVYFLKKDLIIQSIIKPVLTIDNNGNLLTAYSSIKTEDLLSEYDKLNIKKLKSSHEQMVKDNQVFLIRLKEQEAINYVTNSGYKPNELFSVFKDELLNVNSSVIDTFQFI